MKDLIIQVESKTNNDRTHDVRWVKRGEKNTVGYGYKTEDGRVCIIRCPKCGSENYAIAVAQGACAFCGFREESE